MVRGYRTLMFKPDCSPCKTKGLYLSHCYSKMYLNPDGHISTCQSTQNPEDTHICTHQISQNCKVILHTCDPITSKRKPHISGTTSGIHLPHLHSHWVWCLWYGCVMGLDYHNTTSTPKRQTNFFPFYLVQTPRRD